MSFWCEMDNLVEHRLTCLRTITEHQKQIDEQLMNHFKSPPKEKPFKPLNVPKDLAVKLENLKKLQPLKKTSLEDDLSNTVKFIQNKMQHRTTKIIRDVSINSTIY